MLRLASTLENIKVFNLRAGAPVATLTRPLINPHNLQVTAFWVDSKKKESKMLLVKDIRQLAGNKAVVDDLEDIVDTDDLMRYKELIEIDFQLIGKKVLTEKNKTPLGVIEDYAVNGSLQIMQINVRRPIWKNPLDSNLLISRGSVRKVTDKKIYVAEAVFKQPAKKKQVVPIPGNTAQASSSTSASTSRAS
ncbi:hypothetical protein KBC31_03715 [Candidatus Saccharibacteria bacterium]|jgi:hypothetical protein|nr:hypothetical protein [Candidatus Saccharibacteria bacterium]